MEFKKMILDAKAKGLTNEDKMWLAIDIMEEGLEALKEAHPELYWKTMRKNHGILYNGHYSEDYAKHDVDQLHWTDAQGKKHEGAHWTKDDVVAATQGKKFPQGVNDWDKYVAYNAAYSDLNTKFDDSQILDAAYLLYFADEDWRDSKECTKIWDYMNCTR